MAPRTPSGCLWGVTHLAPVPAHKGQHRLTQPAADCVGRDCCVPRAGESWRVRQSVKKLSLPRVRPWTWSPSKPPTEASTWPKCHSDTNREDTTRTNCRGERFQPALKMLSIETSKGSKRKFQCSEGKHCRLGGRGFGQMRGSRILQKKRV